MQIGSLITLVCIPVPCSHHPPTLLYMQSAIFRLYPSPYELILLWKTILSNNLPRTPSQLVAAVGYLKESVNKPSTLHIWLPNPGLTKRPEWRSRQLTPSTRTGAPPEEPCRRQMSSLTDTVKTMKDGPTCRWCSVRMLPYTGQGWQLSETRVCI